MTEKTMRQFLTADTVAKCVAISLADPETLVLCFVGASRTGKTRELLAWKAVQDTQSSLSVTYISNMGLAWNKGVSVSQKGVELNFDVGYPMFLLGNSDVVIIDEPQANIALTQRAFDHTSAVRGPYSHRLLILLFQQMALLERLQIPSKKIRAYSVDGDQLIFGANKKNQHLRLVDPIIGK